MSIKVNALEWQDSALVVFDNWLTVRIADTPFGQYRVDKMDRHRFRVTFGVAIIDAYSSLQDALAAAQADYERRILSAIEPSPDMREVVEALERLSENIASFDAEVAFELSNEGERADLWTDIDVNVEDLRIVVAALRSLTGAKP